MPFRLTLTRVAIIAGVSTDFVVSWLGLHRHISSPYGYEVGCASSSSPPSLVPCEERSRNLREHNISVQHAARSTSGSLDCQVGAMSRLFLLRVASAGFQSQLLPEPNASTYSSRHCNGFLPSFSLCLVTSPPRSHTFSFSAVTVTSTHPALLDCGRATPKFYK